MNNVLKTFLVLFLIFVALYLTGYLNKFPVIKDLPFFENIELTDQCIRKNIDGKYEMSISFDNSLNKNYMRQHLEIAYNLELTKNKCEIIGKGYKSEEQTTDTLSNKRNTLKYDEDKFPVVVTGLLEIDTLYIELSVPTKYNKDYKVNTKFILKKNTVSIIRGDFHEGLSKSTGNAKLRKILDNK